MTRTLIHILRLLAIVVVLVAAQRMSLGVPFSELVAHPHLLWADAVDLRSFIR